MIARNVIKEIVFVSIADERFAPVKKAFARMISQHPTKDCTVRKVTSEMEKIWEMRRPLLKLWDFFLCVPLEVGCKMAHFRENLDMRSLLK